MNPEIEEIFRAVLFMLLRGAAIVTPIVFLIVTYCLLSLPLRRRQRAREFLDLLELGLDQHGAPEQTIIRASDTRDRTLSMRFHMLASHLRAGTSLGEALKQVPRLLPPQVTAMLRVGLETGDLRRVLPACRQVLNDAVSQTRGALNYLAILTFVLLPVVPLLSATLSIWVVPKFEMIAHDMEVHLPQISSSVFALRYEIICAQLFVTVFFQILILCYIGGPRLQRWFGGRWIDRLLWRLPWRRKRVQRDFSTMLALMLDAGVPESRALMLAAEATASDVVLRRALAAQERIANGTKLTDALRGIDDSDELHWRIRNASVGGGFMIALRGWIEILDARAFQQEQSAAQVATTFLVFWNGLSIGLFVFAVFSMLTGIIEGGVLW